MFSLNGTLKKSVSVGRWETEQFIGMALYILMKYLRRFSKIIYTNKAPVGIR